jgi:hypothetical protein
VPTIKLPRAVEALLIREHLDKIEAARPRRKSSRRAMAPTALRKGILKQKPKVEIEITVRGTPEGLSE